MTKSFLVAMLLCLPLAGQEQFARKGPTVTMTPTAVASLQRGKAGAVELHFVVGAGFHVNSNTPTEEFLIPTTLDLDAPTDIVIGRVTYPAGKMASFPFSPKQKLSVYTGEFAVSVVVRPLAEVLPAEYAVHGTLRYQACDNAACYPPKRLPVDFRVRVVKGPRPPRRNPPQSPHVHG